MGIQDKISTICSAAITVGSHQSSDYFQAIRTLVNERNAAAEEDRPTWQEAIDNVYTLLFDEITTSTRPPQSEIKFGTSGWRGKLGKDISCSSVAFVTAAIVQMYMEAENTPSIQQALGVKTFSQLQQRGCVVGFDNRFGGPQLAMAAMRVLAKNGIRLFYAGEATTGALSASVLRRNAACSLNMTPSHNPLEYGGVKYNAADAGPAEAILTETITRLARELVASGTSPLIPDTLSGEIADLPEVEPEDALTSWQELVRANHHYHGIAYDRLLEQLAKRDEVVLCVDCVHGASRSHIRRLLANPPADRLLLLRDTADPTFGGVAPEPSSNNLQPVLQALATRKEPLKIGAVIDPDGDRIRFTDGEVEISMNQFGAMAYHFLHEVKGKQGIVAKTVASSNLANALARQMHEEIFEPRVGFKEFKPVIGKALVTFEESDGISIIGHTPEKDAYIGLILALDMVLSLDKPLGVYLTEIEEKFGHYFPDRDGVLVSQQGRELAQSLEKLSKYSEGVDVNVGGTIRTIAEIIDIDGRKMIFDDGSWIMIRPSGTEPKVRFYVEARNRDDTLLLVKTAKSMLAEIGLLP
ncbi:MAG: phosphoglucomutase [Desulfobulbus propionicus]|nr:MAG: phosphoglucomutase [Desulfobulbus propionicus]